MSDTTLIANARVVNEGRQFDADILLRAGRIERIDSHIDYPAKTHIDARGRWLLPGMIDDQVHFREPGLTQKGNIASESRAAVAGGITSYMEMPNTSPATVTHAAVEDKYRIAATNSWANYAFYLGATNDNLHEIRSIDPTTIAGIKVFMGASTGNMLVDDPDALEAIFREAPTIVATHCEDSPLIAENQRSAIDRYMGQVPLTAHPEIRSEAACHKSSSLAVALAKEHGTRLHVLHLTTARELELFTTGPVDDKQITVEVCVHHLFFDAADYPERGNLIKCNPAIKYEHDRKALLAAVREHRIDIIATDHAPHTLEEKQQPYLQAPAGLPLVQDALTSLLEHVHRGELSIETVVEKTSHNVARRFAIAERGFIREGYWADLTLVDGERKRTIQRAQVLAQCGWSPFEGLTLHGTIDATIVCGHLAYLEGQLGVFKPGQRLTFARA